MKSAIETGIQRNTRVGRSSTKCIPFDKLEPGQSFFVPLSVKSPGAVAMATYRANQNADGKKFQYSGRQTKEVTGEDREITLVAGTRVWRVK